ncbi:MULTISPECIES: hypothetical protein [Nonomuraea]|uniref:hypothetical protein n=1 Tax=Nonomuraea TaxID=83681 RepID=UPI0012FC179B|nr:hypothetical protein [Nonomuraea typhae]
MADPIETSPLAPSPQYPERITPVYERKAGVNGVRRGPLRFEEGVATDTDVPNDFQVGIMQGYVTAPGRPNHNRNVYVKAPAETLKQRAHVGSSSWIEAPTFLGEFAHGSYGDHGHIEYEQVTRYGGHYTRRNGAAVND